MYKRQGNVIITGYSIFSNNPPVCSAAPTLSTHLTNRSYVDGSLNTINTSITTINTNISNIAYTPSTSNTTLSSGNVIITGYSIFSNNPPVCSIAPTLSAHLTNRSYVDGSVNAINANITNINYVSATSNTTISSANVIITGNSIFSGYVPYCAVAPTINAHLTNRSYVDGSVNAINANITNINSNISSAAVSFTSGNVNVGKTLTVGNFSYLHSISEYISTSTALSTNVYTCDITQGSVFNLGNVSTTTTPFQINLLNMPSITSTTNSYINTIIYTGTTNYANQITVSLNSTAGTTTYVLKLNGGTVPTITSTNIVTQQIVYFNISSGTVAALSSINVF